MTRHIELSSVVEHLFEIGPRTGASEWLAKAAG